MKPKHLLLCAIPLAFAACEGPKYSFRAGPTFADVRGNLALADSAGQIPAANSMDGGLGFEDSKSAYFEGQVDIDRHRARFSTMQIDSEGDAVLEQDYGDIVAGTAVNTDQEFTSIVANYTYEVLRDESYRVGLGAQLGYYAMDVNVTGAGVPGREFLETDGFMPMPYFEAEAFLHDLTFGAAGGIMYGDWGDAKGRYWDFDLYTIWNLSDRFDVRGGYRYIVLDGDGRASSRDFDSDWNIQGFYLTFGALF